MPMAQVIDEAAVKVLKDKHLRVTPQRQIVLHYLMTHHNHPDVGTMFDELKPVHQGLSLATIYNTLNTLVETGIVIELENGDAGTHYDYFGRPHFHAVCQNCGKITDIFYDDFANLESAAVKQSGYMITEDHIELYGYCPDCQRKLGLTPDAK
ncbi:transcriptional repressor [Lactobacillus rossiae]|nr:transcriptional repressor [Furfurilactobacillus milii]